MLNFCIKRGNERNMNMLEELFFPAPNPGSKASLLNIFSLSAVFYILELNLWQRIEFTEISF